MAGKLTHFVRLKFNTSIQKPMTKVASHPESLNLAIQTQPTVEPILSTLLVGSRMTGGGVSSSQGFTISLEPVPSFRISSFATDDVLAELDELRVTVALLKEQMQKLLEARVFTISLLSLGHSDVVLQKAITVTIRPDEDEFIASFLDANISSGGGTIPEAVSNLQSLIADIFLLHEDEVEAWQWMSLEKLRKEIKEN